ncbi:CDP-alcohol phosphatidyltransferase family protein [Rhodohalobacter mucosus]|uniref:CDP-diacylglycerol--glycerol-3-phosphate 3-phosphatidyltransferase n=1 Tax=Rhodohalobacter mucosus TaxID=2079485 RepID=A0A316TMS9_9BACT|nr:CDP-alcohol phosphatidyltransferase family protein [Rhodohalobacter mucosus]PWN05907.1 CDP-alcohol phosphatidyltransferase family protein [Rhodohalobacter mucosus]
MGEVINIDGKKIKVRDYIYTWSNFISFTRILVVIPIIWLHINNGFETDVWIIVLIIYGVISDYLDGLVARWRDEISELGKILDPIADKLMAFFLFLYTVILGWIPLWYFFLGVVRDLLIMAGSAHIKRKRGKVAMSIMSGKITVNAMALYWISVFFFREAETAQTFLMVVSALMMIVSFIEYKRRYYKIINGADFN